MTIRPACLAALWALCAIAGPGVVRPALALPAPQDAVQVVEVPLRAEQLLALPGVTEVAVVDDAICRAQVLPDGLRFFGLLRGDTVVFVWRGDERLTLLVRVTPPPVPTLRPGPSTEQVARLGLGQVSTSTQAAIGPDRRPTYHFQHAFGWSQQAGDSLFSVTGQARHTSVPDVPLNVDSAQVRYASRTVAVTLFDIGLTLNGGADARVAASSPLTTFVIRGADLALTRGGTAVELFAGTSIPTYYRSFRGTSRIAGLNISHRLSPRLTLYSTAAGVRDPRAGTSAFQTAGLTYRAADVWAGQLTGGIGTRGGYGDAAVTVSGDRLSASATFSASSPGFSLNQLQVLSGGGRAARANATWRGTSRVTASAFLQHSDTRVRPGFPAFAGSADYISPALSLALSPTQSLSLNGVYSRSRGGVTPDHRALTRTLNLGWNAQAGRFTNSLQVSGDVTEDSREGGDDRVALGLRNHLTMRIGQGSLSIGFQQRREDPSLTARLRQELGLLSPDLQELFLVDPVAFVQSDLLPAAVRDLLDSLRSAQSQASIAGQFRVGRRLQLSASYSLLRNTPAPNRRSTTNAFGYTLAYQLSRDLQLRSSLSDTYLLDSRQRDLVRTTTVQVGLQVNFRGGPALLTGAAREHRIAGRVFIDRNVTGTDEAGEPGLAGFVVRLENGRTALTDADGRFEFRDLRPGTYRVAMPLDQFPAPVRVTTPARVTVDLFERPQTVVHFGVVNFARIWGTVFNDYAHEGARRADAPGLDKVSLTVTAADGAARRVTTDGSGDFRIDDLEPGTYRLEVDRATIPANFLHLAEPIQFEVKPVQTLVVDVPVRALRSVAGHVLIADAAGELSPAAGVTVAAGQAEATTDQSGYFILRDLPAGDLTVRIKTDRPLPPGLSVPSGAVRMPKEPIAVEGATIVLRNPSLMEYLVPRGRT